MSLKKILITGFDPFGGETVNPSWECIKALPDETGNAKLFKLQLPTVYGKAAESAINAAEEIRPDVILCVGQAGGRKDVTPEMVGINVRDAKIADNEGRFASGEKICEDGEAAYFTTIGARIIAEKLGKKGLPCSVSYSAGTFVCNDLLYSLLRRFDGEAVRIGFVHVPFFPEQAAEGVPSLDKEKTVEVLREIIDLV